MFKYLVGLHLKELFVIFINLCFNVLFSSFFFCLFVPCIFTLFLLLLFYFFTFVFLARRIAMCPVATQELDGAYANRNFESTWALKFWAQPSILLGLQAVCNCIRSVFESYFFCEEKKIN